MLFRPVGRPQRWPINAAGTTAAAQAPVRLRAPESSSVTQVTPAPGFAPARQTRAIKIKFSKVALGADSNAGPSLLWLGGREQGASSGRR